MTTNKHDRKEGQHLTAVLRNGGCSASYDSFVVGSSAVLRLNFCAKNPPLRKAAIRYNSLPQDRRRMKKIIPLIILVVLTSCNSSDKNAPLTKEVVTENHADSISTLGKDSIISSYNPVDTVVTKRLLSFVSYLDSIGFNCDTNRLKKIYGGHSKNIRYNINNHFFYASTPETSGLSTYFNYFAKDKKYEQAWHIDTETLKKSKSIIWYFFSELKPDQFNGEKWYTDAIIEEWKFNDSTSAKIAAKDIGAIAPRLYFNVGAFVCYIDNYMYIITSRSSGSMWTIRKPVFKAFATRNRVTITNTDKWF